MGTTSFSASAAPAKTQSAVVCEVCRQQIVNRRELHLLRERNALREETEVHMVHTQCVASMKVRLQGVWDAYPVPSPEASWFTPVQLKKPYVTLAKWPILPAKWLAEAACF